MGHHHYMDYLLKEHEELLQLAEKIENLLERAGNNNFSEHTKTLGELRALDHGLAGIAEHCHATDRLVESAYYKNLPPKDLARINTDHLLLLNAVTSFREELKFATADRTMAMILPGMDLVKLLRAHVAFEGELLHRISGREESTSRVTHSGKARTAGKKRHQGAKKKVQKQPAPDTPYTLEPHPEF